MNDENKEKIIGFSVTFRKLEIAQVDFPACCQKKILSQAT
jgi:hypothetical protein